MPESSHFGSFGCESQNLMEICDSLLVLNETFHVGALELEDSFNHYEFRDITLNASLTSR